MAGDDKTEKATPKRRGEARKRGQVAKSADLNGAVVLLASLAGISAFGPRLVSAMEDTLAGTLGMISDPQSVFAGGGLRSLALELGKTAATAVGPILLICMLAGILVNVGQVKFVISGEAIKPSPQKLNPLNGIKQLFNPKHAGVETGKALAKVGVVGALTALSLLPQLEQLAALVGTPADALGHRLVSMILSVAQRAGIAYLLIGAIDYAWQRYKHEKSIRMTKEEVKEEFKQQQTNPEVRAAVKRRQIEAARRRMMSAVPDADVVVTNPTHYAVALRYDPAQPAPEVLAKGKDLVAARIREAAREAGVPVVADPPLARALHRSVEIGQLIPEELFQAVAELLAFVYRTARRRVATA